MKVVEMSGGGYRWKERVESLQHAQEVAIAEGAKGATYIDGNAGKAVKLNLSASTQT